MAARRETEFTEYVRSRRTRLWRFAYLLCADPHTAEDLTQIALTKLYVAWPRVRRDGAEDAYARKIVLRCHLDERRRPWRREHTSTVDLDVEIGPEPSGLPYEDSEQLRDAVRELPPRQRAAVVLRYWWGLSLEETAADLGCSVGTVKSQTSRAVERLRAALTENTRTERAR